MSKRTRTFLAGIALLAIGANAYAQDDLECLGCVDSRDIAREAVGTAKIGKQAVTTSRIAPKAVTGNKIANGTVGLRQVGPKLKADIGTYCAPGMVVIGKDSSGNFVCEPPSGRAATCDELLFSGQVWGLPATGFDLRERTYSTLHFVGCATDGCDPETFYCTYDEAAQTLAFGTTDFILRALVDPGDALGDSNPTVSGGCCSVGNPNGLCNAPDSNGNGTGVDPAVALCDVLGYKHGTIVREILSNTCPEVHATSESGLRWSSDYDSTAGYGAEYLCSDFK